MSRILEALTKVEAQRGDAPAVLPRASEARARAEAEAAARAAAPAGHAAAALPAAEWEPADLPRLPEHFERELAGLRVQVETALAGRRPRVLLMTASTTGEGTTTVAASFARVLAADGVTRVLLVDANAHQPALASYFGLPASPGLAQALAAGLAVESLLRAAGRHNLHVLPAMRGEAAASRLYSQPELRRFLAEVGARYDYVIFDAPPVLEAPETVVRGGVVDTSILVVRAALTKSGVAARAVDTLAKAGVPLLGVVLNRRRFEIPEFIYKRI